MKIQIAPSLVALGLILLIVAACSSSGKLEMKQAKSRSIPPGKTVTLVIESEPVNASRANPSNTQREDNPDGGESQEENKENKENSVRMIQRLRTELFGRLVSEAVFKHVLHPQEKGDYLMVVQVLDTEEVSQGARIFFGVLAGSNKLRCSIRLVDQATNRLITEFNVEGESASHPLSSENGLDDAVREVVSKAIIALR